MLHCWALWLRARVSQVWSKRWRKVFWMFCQGLQMSIFKHLTLMENLNLKILGKNKGVLIRSSCPFDCSQQHGQREIYISIRIMGLYGSIVIFKKPFTPSASCTVWWSSRLTPTRQLRDLGCEPNPLPASLGKHEGANSTNTMVRSQMILAVFSTLLDISD